MENSLLEIPSEVKSLIWKKDVDEPLNRIDWEYRPLEMNVADSVLAWREFRPESIKKKFSSNVK